MNLINTSALSLISTIIKIISGFLINKFISIYAGPAGLAIIGQFQNFLQISLTLAQGGINGGVIKYVAEYKNDDENCDKIINSAFLISLITSIIVGLLILFTTDQLAFYLFKNLDYVYILKVFAFTVVMFVANNLFLSVLNGKREIKKYISINIIQSIYSLIVTSVLIRMYSIEGALLAMSINQSIVFLMTYWLLNGREVLKWSRLEFKIRSQYLLHQQ